MKSSHLWRTLTWCILAFVFCLTTYRANSQTIAQDEALEYEWFLDGGVVHILSYNPANHILFTLLAKPIVWCLGNREIILRSPSLLPSPFVSALASLLAVVVLYDYILSLQTKSFCYNTYDVISRDIYKAISTDAQARGLSAGGRNVVARAGNQYLSPARQSRLDDGVRHQGPFLLVADAQFPRPADYDYFVFAPAGDSWAGRTSRPDHLSRWPARDHHRRDFPLKAVRITA
jgi:hypothetical protein